MDFFKPVVNEKDLHANFKSVCIPARLPERKLFAEWASGFQDRDNKIVQEFQKTFNSTFWEVYLYACFKEYGFGVDWSYNTPDFLLEKAGVEFVVEATTGNAANGKPNEWERSYSAEELAKLTRFGELNREAMIRLSNAVGQKAKRYRDFYSNLEYVAGKPFVVAVAPFEQPYFNLQYDRPIRALLYGQYVDEDAALDHPEMYPDGPPTVILDHILKDNGSPVKLGIFGSEEMQGVSAVVFSCVATWGKLSAMSTNEANVTYVMSTWSNFPDGAPEKRMSLASQCGEVVTDGLQVYHNPYASHPLPPNIFRRPGVVQHYFDERTNDWVYEGRCGSLLTRQVAAFRKPKGKGA